MRGRPGRFFAHGTTAGRRGYHRAYPVRRGGEIVGVLAVEVDPGEMERLWPGGDSHVLVLDGAGTLLMSDRADLLHRPAGPASATGRIEPPPLPLPTARFLPPAPAIPEGNGK